MQRGARCDGWTVHARLSLLVSTARKGMAATVCNGLKSLYSIRAIEYTHALQINSSSSSIPMIHISHYRIRSSLSIFNYNLKAKTLPDLVNNVKEEMPVQIP